MRCHAGSRHTQLSAEKSASQPAHLPPSSPTRHTAIHCCRVFDRLSAVAPDNRCMGSICSRRNRIEIGTQTAALRGEFAVSNGESPSEQLRRRYSLPRQRFIAAVRRVINLLRLRRKWAAYGRVLQQQPRADLWTGLTRRSGILYRLHAAHTPPWQVVGHHRQSRTVRTAAPPDPQPQRRNRASIPRTTSVQSWYGKQ